MNLVRLLTVRGEAVYVSPRHVLHIGPSSTDAVDEKGCIPTSVLVLAVPDVVRSMAGGSSQGWDSTWHIVRGSPDEVHAALAKTEAKA